MPLVKGNKPKWRNDFLCEHLMVNPDIPQWEGVRGERYVYARYFSQKPVYEFLHDLQKDPSETMNFASDPKYFGVLTRMKKRLKQLLASFGGEYSRERFPILPESGNTN